MTDNTTRPSFHRRQCLAALGALGLGAACGRARAEASRDARLAPSAEPLVGLWRSPDEVRALPAKGAAWQRVEAAAAKAFDAPDLQHGDQESNVLVLARALMHARTGDERCKREVLEACRAVIGSEDGRRGPRPESWQDVRALAPARELPAYVIAADLVGLPEDLARDFKAWAKELLGRRLGGHSLRSCHEDRPNNWGTHAGAARIAVAGYVGDGAELARAAAVFKGWLGDRDLYAGFKFRALDWQADPDRPVGVNPRGATREGRSIDGVLPDDQRRAEDGGGGFVWPPPKENYVWEALQGAMLQAALLARLGYPDVYTWQDKALLRAVRWLVDVAQYPAEGDDTWQMPLVDGVYGTRFWNGKPTRPGKNVGYTCWTHAPDRR